MPFCPKCESEFRPGFTRCEECDADLIPILPEPPPRPVVESPGLSPVYSSTDLPDALLVGAILEGQGITAHVENQHSGLMVLGLPTVAIPFVVTVPSAEAPDATEILKEMKNHRSSSSSTRRVSSRLWLWGIILLVPVLSMRFWSLHFPYRGYEHFLAAGAWGTLVFALILQIRARMTDASFSELRILFFWLAGACGSTSLAYLVETAFKDSIPGLRYQFVIVGPAEETFKLLPVLVLFWLRPSWFRDPRAWVVSAAASGAGFGLSENVFKYSGADDYSSSVTIAVSGLLHPFLSGFVAYCIAGMGAFRLLTAVVALGFAAVIHAGWNSLNLSGFGWICLVAMAVTIWAYLSNVDSLFPKPSEASPAQSFTGSSLG